MKLLESIEFRYDKGGQCVHCDANENSLSPHDLITANNWPLSEQRAMELLKKTIPCDLYTRYLYEGCIPVVGEITGKTYLIRRRNTVLEIDSMGYATHSFCIHSPSKDQLPSTDDVFVLWFLIQRNEAFFLKTANRSKHRIPCLDTTDDVLNYRHVGSKHTDMPYEIAYNEQTFGTRLINVWEKQREGKIWDIGFFPGDKEGLDDGVPIPDFYDLPKPKGNNNRLFSITKNYKVCRIERENLSGMIGNQLVFGEDYNNPDDHRNYYNFPVSSALSAMADCLNPQPSARDGDGSLVTRGLASFCLSVMKRHVDDGYTIVHTDRGRVRVPMVPWPSSRFIDDAFIFQLVAAYTKCLHDAVVHSVGPLRSCDIPRPTHAMRKAIMSTHVYDRLQESGSDIFDLNILIDDRMENFIAKIPSGVDLGYIIKEEGGDRVGMCITEPHNVVMQYFDLHSGRPSTLNLELAMETLYSPFPDGCTVGMCYDMLVFEYAMDAAPTTPNGNGLELEWRAWPRGYTEDRGMRDMDGEIQSVLCNGNSLNFSEMCDAIHNVSDFTSGVETKATIDPITVNDKDYEDLLGHIVASGIDADF